MLLLPCRVLCLTLSSPQRLPWDRSWCALGEASLVLDSLGWGLIGLSLVVTFALPARRLQILAKLPFIVIVRMRVGVHGSFTLSRSTFSTPCSCTLDGY